MQTGGEHGMQTMNWSLFTLYKKGDINYEEAMYNCTDRKEMERIIKESRETVNLLMREGLIPEMPPD